MSTIRGMIVSCVAMALLAGVTRADVLTIDYNDGTRAAQATFEIFDLGGGNSELRIKLENLTTVGVEIPMQVLTGLWFNIADPANLSTGAVWLTDGSSILNADKADNDPDGDGVELIGGTSYVSGEFGMETGAAVSALFPQFNVAIANVGMDDLVGTDDLFAGQNLDDPNSPDGFNYGILGASGLASDANNPLLEDPLIIDGVWISLNYAGALTLSDITNVVFNYGTDASPIPVPGAAVLAMVGMGLVGWVRRRSA